MADIYISGTAAHNTPKSGFRFCLGKKVVSDDK